MKTKNTPSRGSLESAIRRGVLAVLTLTVLFAPPFLSMSHARGSTGDISWYAAMAMGNRAEEETRRDKQNTAARESTVIVAKSPKILDENRQVEGERDREKE